MSTYDPPIEDPQTAEDARAEYERQMEAMRLMPTAVIFAPATEQPADCA